MIEAVELLDGPSDAEIANREHVKPSERKDQEHMYGPNANPFDGSQHFDDLFIAHSRQAVEFERSVLRFSREVFDERDLAVGHSYSSDRLVGRRQNLVGPGESAGLIDGLETAENHL